MRRRSFVGALVLGAILVTATACKEEGGVKIADFTFTGVAAVSEGQLKSVLSTTESDKLPWGTKHYFSREQFEADLKRIEAFYKDRGYPNARVKSFDASLSQDQTSVKIRVDVEEGQPTTVERLVLEGFEGLPDENVQALEARLPLKAGQPLDRALLQASREAALDELKERGYPYARITLVEEAGSSEQQKALMLRADTGPLAHFGPIEIVGNSSVSDGIVRRQVTYHPGETYRQSKLLESQRGLYGLELFDFANVQTLRTEDRAIEIPTRVTVTEGKHRRINFGAGYGTEEQARVQVDWRHVNFFGGARTAGVLARYSGLDRGVRLNFTEPFFFSRWYSFGLTGQAWRSDEPAYKLDAVGGRATVTRRFGRGVRIPGGANADMSLSLSYGNEFTRCSIDPDILLDLSQRDDVIAIGCDPTRGGEAEGQLSSLSIDAGRNTTGNIIDARRGYVASLHLEQAGRWLGGDYNYVEVTADGRYYYSIGDRAVLAVRGRIGSIDGTGVEAEVVPFFKRYFLGGASNLRGWGRFDVAPLSGSGLPIGGHSVMNFSTELRVPLFGKLSGVLFLDGGNVWTNSWDFNLNDLRYDAGPGLRYNTPIGPIRVDLGIQLNRIAGLLVNGEPEPRRFRVHFSIGQAF